MMNNLSKLWQGWASWRGLLFVALICSLLTANAGLSYANSSVSPVAQANPGAAQAAQLPITGTFYFISGGPQPFFYLLDDKGQNSELLIDPAVLAAGGGATTLNRSRVRLSGTNLGISRTLNGGSALQVTAIQPDLPPGQNTVIKPLVTGSRPFVNILCRFGDSIGTTPQPASFVTGLMSNTRPGLDHYFRESSEGAIDLVGSQVVGWFDLPQPRSYYFTADPPNFLRMASDCSALADATINFNDFQGINFIFNQNFGCCAWGGAIGLTLDGTSKAWPSTWMPPGGLFQSIFAHEMGHAFGMPHSANVLGTTYQNAWDVMSKDRFNCAADTDPTYGCVGQHSIAYHKDIPGWIPTDRKLVTTPAGGTYDITLERLAQAGGTGYLMAKIPINGNATKYYTVEARYRVGYDTKVANDAVIIHQVDTTRLDDAWTVDADGNSDSSDAGAQWLVGETFTDAANGISVQVVSATASGFVVSINVTPPPTLVVHATATSANVTVGGNVNWFKFDAPVATLYTLETFNTGTLTDTVMKLYGPGNTTSLLTQNDDIGGGNLMSKISRQFLNPGTYYVAVNAKFGNSTGTYSIALTAPLLITKNTDVPADPGSLSYAIGQAQPGDAVVFMLTGNNIIALTQSVVINTNIQVQGQCTNGPGIILDGSGAPVDTDGLVLNAKVNLSGILISGFSGRQIKAFAGGSQFNCVQAMKSPIN